MTLDDAILALLTYRPAKADEIQDDLRDWHLKVEPFQPGDILNTLDRLCLEGKATLVVGEGYRKPSPMPSGRERQGSFL